MALGAVHLALLLALHEFPALVIGVAALGQSDLDLREAVDEVDLERDEGEALFVDLAGQPIDLASVNQQLPLPLGIVTARGRVRVRGDVGVLEPQFAVLERCICVLELHLARRAGSSPRNL